MPTGPPGNGTLHGPAGLRHADRPLLPAGGGRCPDPLPDSHDPGTPDRYPWYTSWEIVLQRTNTAIGGIGFQGYPDEAGATEVGFMLDGRMQGQGFATEALKAMVEWAFTDGNTRSVTARTYQSNTPARRLLVRAGFREEGTSGELVTCRIIRP